MSLLSSAPSNGVSAVSDTRLEDYLNDKLQTFADFETLDSLLANVKTQQELLRKQLEDAEQDLEEADQASANQAAAVQRQAIAYEKQQGDIDRRLRIITQSDTSDEALKSFDASMQKLRDYDLANNYLTMMMEVEDLSGQATQQVADSSGNALGSYTKLRNLLTRLKTLQVEAEGAAPHLVDHVEQATLNVRRTIRDALAANLDSILKKMLWPKPDVAMPAGVLQEFNDVCGKLLALQKPELEAEKLTNADKARGHQPAVLLPLEVMVQPLEQRFRFHFSGDKPTNRLDKPEYFLSHALDLLNTYSPFVSDNLQPVVSRQFRGSSLTVLPSYFDATSALITALLPMVRNKVLALVSQISNQPQLLSHLIHELMGFDTILRDEWRYTTNDPSGGITWKGLTWEILTEHNWFARWLQIEKDFALQRYQSIVDDTSSSSLDYDTVNRDVTKPTKGAIRVNDLLETVTEVYRPLSSFSQKLHFLIDIQISILDSFHHRLQSSLQGTPFADLAGQGVTGLDRVCRVFGSADYLERAMLDWSDDVFFLDLWSELQRRAKNANGEFPGEGASTAIAGPLTVSEIASRTSNILASNSNNSAEDGFIDNDDTTGALFDETAGAYRRLREHHENVLIDLLVSTARESLRPYARNTPWSSLSANVSTSSADAESLSTSIELNPALTKLSTNLGFLNKALGTLPLRRVGRQTVRRIDNYFFESVLMGNKFSLHGAQQVSVDIDALARLADKFIGGHVGGNGLRRCVEACALLSLPLKGREDIVNGDEESTDPTSGDEAWEADDVSSPQAKDAPETDEFLGIGLWEVERRLLHDDDGASSLFEELGFGVLTEKEAGELLKRRVELSY